MSKRPLNGDTVITTENQVSVTDNGKGRKTIRVGPALAGAPVPSIKDIETARAKANVLSRANAKTFTQQK